MVMSRKKELTWLLLNAILEKRKRTSTQAPRQPETLTLPGTFDWGTEEKIAYDPALRGGE